MTKLTRLGMRKPLPVRDGLSPSAIWMPEDETYTSVLAFLLHAFPDISAHQWCSRMEKREVVSEEGTPFYPDTPYQGNQHLFYYRFLESETPIPFEEFIIFEDEHLIVADKPHFLPTVPAGRFLHHTLLVRLQKRFNQKHLVPIHRLDRETAGVVIFSKTPATRGRYQQLFAERKVSKTYEALAPPLAHLQFPQEVNLHMKKGTPFFRMTTTDAPPNSATRIEILEKGKTSWLYKLIPLTGKKHQLRIHMSYLGAPILNDPFYPTLQPDKGNDFSHPLQLLARSVSFTDPFTHEKRFFESSRQLES